MYENEKDLANAYKPYYGNEAASTSPIRRPAVQSELELIEKYDHEFGELLNVLESKLSPVLRQQAEQADGRKEGHDVPLTTLVGDLQNASARRIRFANAVRDLIDRLEI